MSAKTGISKKTYGRLESGQEFVAIKHYLNACIFLDVDFEKEINDALKLKRRRVRRKPSIAASEVNF